MRFNSSHITPWGLCQVSEKMKASNVQRVNVLQLVEAFKPQLQAKVGAGGGSTDEALQAAFRDVVNQYNSMTTGKSSDHWL